MPPCRGQREPRAHGPKLYQPWPLLWPRTGRHSGRLGSAKPTIMPHRQHATRSRRREKIASRAPPRPTQQPRSTAAADQRLARAGHPAAPPTEPPVSCQASACALASAATGTRQPRRRATAPPPCSPRRPPSSRSWCSKPAKGSSERTASEMGGWRKAGEHGTRADRSSMQPHAACCWCGARARGARVRRCTSATAGAVAPPPQPTRTPLSPGAASRPGPSLVLLVGSGIGPETVHLQKSHESSRTRFMWLERGRVGNHQYGCRAGAHTFTAKETVKCSPARGEGHTRGSAPSATHTVRGVGSQRDVRECGWRAIMQAHSPSANAHRSTHVAHVRGMCEPESSPRG